MQERTLEIMGQYIYCVAEPVDQNILVSNQAHGDIVRFDGMHYKLYLEVDSPREITLDFLNEIDKNLFILKVTRQSKTGRIGNDRYRINRVYTIDQFKSEFWAFNVSSIPVVQQTPKQSLQNRFLQTGSIVRTFFGDLLPSLFHLPPRRHILVLTKTVTNLNQRMNQAV